MTSLSFDRAASFYDDTRTLPPELSERITQHILDLAHGRRILEVGVGTGRIAAPLLERGARLTGIDLSREMMDRLRGKFARATLAQADVLSLPFAAGSFGVLLAVHVLHLVGGWRDALREFKRVLAPDGVYLNSYNERPPDSPNQQLRKRWHTLVEARGQQWRRPGIQDRDELLAELQNLGARVDARAIGRRITHTTPQRELDDIAARVHSDTWQVSDDVLAATVVELREWAVKQYGDLNQTITLENDLGLDVIYF
jgi:ubiquinone/menaquinone biosynthesis C-methylase UbiE